MSNRLIQLAALFITAVALLGAFLLTPAINQQRVDRQLTYDLEVGNSTNPSYALWAAAGSFRGVAINVAWQRSEALKQDGKFFESNNLAEWITTMQPRFPDAWDIQAWNMAYNISVKCKTAQERWDWVKKGMTLLRDRGIPNNPNAVVLYRSMAWIMGHKMAGQTDDMHKYYKLRLCETWQTLLGVPDPRWVLKPEYQDPAKRSAGEELDPLVHGDWLATLQFGKILRQANTYLLKPDRTEDDYRPTNYFTTLSPDALARFYADNPGLEAVVKDLETLRGPEGQDLELGLNTRTLRAFGRLQMYQDAGYPVTGPVINNPQTLGLDAMAVLSWLTKPKGSVMINLNPLINPKAALEQQRQRDPDAQIVDVVPMFDLLRAIALISEYHMDPAFMHQCMERFGPIDWRHPSAHACYWSAMGTLRAEEWTLNKERVDLVNANRNIIHALQKLAHNGKISFRPKVEGMGRLGEESINHTPDIRMIPAYDRAWEETVAKAKAGDFGERHADRDTYANGHENFLQAAVYLYYFEGKERLARDYFDRASELYASSPTSPAANDGHYNLNLPDFARVRMEDDLGFQEVARINYMIRSAWSRGLAQRDASVMKRYLDAAKTIYDDFLEDRQTERKADLVAQARQGLPPFDQLVRDHFVEMMISPEYSLPQKAGIWQLGGPLLNAYSDDSPLAYEAYAMMMGPIRTFASAEGWGEEITANFPKPRGFDEWYQQANPQSQPQPPLPLPGTP